MTTKSLPPSIEEVAFNCPHCGAFASQNWFQVHASMREGKDNRTPGFPAPDARDNIKKTTEFDAKMKDRLLKYINDLESGLVSIERIDDSRYHYFEAHNLNLSKCFACNGVAVWVHKNLIFPPTRTGPQPNEDLPEGILRDYEEASSILSLSPRGAAALLRLAIQKLCAHLGEKGKNVDEDIASLVRKGLSPLIQKALDAVRVTGNEAVHPGALDLRDDPETAGRLFKLVNVIAEQMISNPKHVEEAYGKLPEEKRKAIENRDKRSD